MKFQLNYLRLVYPPISNQEAEWLKDYEDVQKEIKRSNLYMICQRPEAFFDLSETTIQEELQNGLIHFKLQTKDCILQGAFDVNELIKLYSVDLDKYIIELETGRKFVRFWSLDKTTGKRVDIVDWFTTEKTLFDKWRGHPVLKGLINYRELTKYYLHYVGISKKEDSLTRLVIRPHDKRLRVLSNEYPDTEGSRLTDEIFLLFFTVDPLRITTIETDDDIDEMVNGVRIDRMPIIADAEKAYVKILESEYNTIKYADYPKGGDGLYGTGLIRYGYLLCEDITLITTSESIRGEYVSERDVPKNIDCIFINGDSVTLIKPQRSDE